MIFFLIPVYDEEANIPNLFSELSSLALKEAAFYVFSDDGSTDKSKEVIGKFFGSTSHIILGDGTNRGPGAAFNTGFEWILVQSKSPDDCVVTLEADNTSDLSILPVMLMLSKANYDLVLASVYAQGGGFEKTSFFRKFVSATANFLFRFLFNVQVLTLSSFYRVYSISVLKKVKEKYGTLTAEPGFICMLEILIRCLRVDARVIEVPMKLHSSRRQGVSKMKVFKTTMQYFRFLLMNRK